MAAQFFTFRSHLAPYVLTMWLRPTSWRHAPHYLYVRLSNEGVYEVSALVRSIMLFKIIDYVMKFFVFAVMAIVVIIALLLLVPDSGVGNGSLISGPSGHIPKSANDIEWHSPALGPMYVTKFKVNEVDFKEWARGWREREVNLSQIQNGGAMVYEYDFEMRKLKRIEIENSFYLYHQVDDRSLTIAYDLKTGIAY
jgi:hypothetical protein